jgi:hypothetical protein
MRHQNLFQRSEPKSVEKWIAGRSFGFPLG